MPTEFTGPNKFVGVRVTRIDVNIESPNGAFFVGEYALELSDGMRVKSAYPKQNWSEKTLEVVSDLLASMEADLVQDLTGDYGSPPNAPEDGEDELRFPR